MIHFHLYSRWWEPSDCRPTVKVAILIPYRKRPQQLSLFLNHMIPVFQRQLLSFRIFIVEQVSYFRRGPQWGLLPCPFSTYSYSVFNSCSVSFPSLLLAILGLISFQTAPLGRVLFPLAVARDTMKADASIFRCFAWLFLNTKSKIFGVTNQGHHRTLCWVKQKLPKTCLGNFRKLANLSLVEI